MIAQLNRWQHRARGHPVVVCKTPAKGKKHPDHHESGFVFVEKALYIRITHGDLTQQDLADRAGCSRQTIHSIESGKFVPSVELVLKIAKTLGCAVEDIFKLGEAE